MSRGDTGATPGDGRAGAVRFVSAVPHFTVGDVVRTAEYYRDVLGFEVEGYWDGERVHHDRERTVVFGIVRRGGVRLHLNRGTGPRPSKSAGAYDVYFHVTGVDALAASLRDRGADIVEGPETRSYGQREIVLRDCNGLAVAFGEDTTAAGTDGAPSHDGRADADGDFPMPFDFEVEPGLSFGEWFRRELEERVHFENEPEWLERVRVPAERLQRARPANARFEVLVPWVEVRTAWIVPGRYVYFARELLERLPDEEAVAFVIAHEIAHSDLGHLDFFQGMLGHLDDLPLGGAIAAVLHHFLRRAYSPEQELDADRVGLELCLSAGYDGQRCLRVFHALKLIALDLGAIDAVFGPGFLGKAAESQWIHRAKMWIWQRGAGYLPIEDRRRLLEEQLERHERSR